MSRTPKAQTQGPSQIGPYRIIEVIGRGGMGAVYRAFDERLDRFVALKRRHRGVAREELRWEAKAVARLSHSNIVQVYDFLEQNERESWIVMELVDGPNLRSLIRRRPLCVKQTLRIGLDVARALEVAHGRGIVHSDLKTENVMLCSSGAGKILDFGLAQRVQNPSESRPGEIRGTPRTMSPEQAKGEPATPRSDLFSLGVLLYECLTGASPFEREPQNLVQTLTAVCQFEPKPLSKVLKNVPAALSDLVERLMSKQPDGRPSDAGEVALALSRISHDSEETLRVLFVDDEADLERLLRQWFRREIRDGKMQLSFARSGVEALDVLHGDPSIELVFTDLNMPQMGGLELIAELEKMRRPTVAVVLSAYGDMVNIRAAMNLGAFDFLTKPLDFDDLERTLRKAANQLTQARERRRLRSENELLDQRNRLINETLQSRLESESGARTSDSETLPGSSDRSQGSQEQWIRLVVHGLAELPRHVQGPDLMGLLMGIAGELLEMVGELGGRVASWDGAGMHLAFAGLDAAALGETVAPRIQERIRTWSDRSRALGGPALQADLTVDPYASGPLPRASIEGFGLQPDVVESLPTMDHAPEPAAPQVLHDVETLGGKGSVWPDLAAVLDRKLQLKAMA